MFYHMNYSSGEWRKLLEKMEGGRGGAVFEQQLRDVVLGPVVPGWGGRRGGERGGDRLLNKLVTGRLDTRTIDQLGRIVFAN